VVITLQFFSQIHWSIHNGHPIVQIAGTIIPVPLVILIYVWAAMITVSVLYDHQAITDGFRVHTILHPVP